MHRIVFDPLEPSKAPRWFVVRNMHWAVLEAHELPVGVDLKRAFVAAILAAEDYRSFTSWNVGWGARPP